MDRDITHLTSEMDKNPPADPKTLINIITRLGFNFAPDYIDFMSEHNGAEGAVLEGEWLRLIPIEELEVYNQDYEVSEYLPNIFFIGSNCGGDAFGIRKAEGTFIQVPFVDMEEEAIWEHGNTFKDFLTSISKAFDGMANEDE
ncbi:SMI1/KNR4 family protein [Chitinophaga sp. S165]|uniref:SMI1/KNR4 family protein n=1 Tax=Chitinophaga sp. S165 TaxID=2135462 RepID=UPI001304FCCF|nr:SMI1/KNR4 family protein [Chitinophaga sp. S165]